MKLEIFLRTDKDIQTAIAAMTRLINGKTKYQVTIEPRKIRRTSPQNRYYFGCVVKFLADYFGYTVGQMHDELLGQHFGWKEVRGPKGRRKFIPVRRSTTDADGRDDTVSKQMFSDLITTGLAIAAEEGIAIPSPEEYMGENGEG
jgi:hypothetical protein